MTEEKGENVEAKMKSESSKEGLKIEKLNLFYGENQALFDIDMDVRAQRVTALIGPSGCGKSTLLRSINRMNDMIDGVKISGRITYNGVDIYQDYDVIELRKHIGMVFQKPNPFPMSIFENVAYGPKVHGIKNQTQLQKIVMDSLEQAALWNEVKDRLNASALGLSGGQQQRLCIARALAVEPEVLLMDEPTSALDPRAAGRIEELINSLRKNYTIVIVTHNMQQAGRVSDDTAFFLHGYVKEFGTTERLFFNPQNAETEAYIAGKFG